MRANFNMQYAVFAKIESETAGAAPTYTAGKVLGKAMEASIKPNFMSAELWGDGAISADFKELISAEVTVGLNSLPGDVAADMFGSTYTAESDNSTESLSEKNTDVVNYGGFGFVVTSVKNNVKSYDLIWLPKVKFDSPEEKFKQIDGSITFNTPSLSGKAVYDNTGEWRYREYFSTAALAIAALKTKAGISE